MQLTHTLPITRDVKFAFFSNSNFVCKIRILFELCLGPQSVEYLISLAMQQKQPQQYIIYCMLIITT